MAWSPVGDARGRVALVCAQLRLLHAMRIMPTMTRNLLFICSQNRWRSPTAEHVFEGLPGVYTASAGLNHDAEQPVTPELLAWADIVFVMERVHRSKLAAKFRRHLRDTRVVCLDIPDDYVFMDPALVALLQRKVPPYLPAT